MLDQKSVLTELRIGGDGPVFTDIHLFILNYI